MVYISDGVLLTLPFEFSQLNKFSLSFYMDKFYVKCCFSVSFEGDLHQLVKMKISF